MSEDATENLGCHSYTSNDIISQNKGREMDNATGFLTTHILDTAGGIPAANVKIELYRLSDNNKELLIATKTNSDGRTDTPLLAVGEMAAGVYELVFHIGDYFAGASNKQPNAFIDVVPIRFGIADEQSHYHVPLLASPFSFSTYRGS